MYFFSITFPEKETALVNLTETITGQKQSRGKDNWAPLAVLINWSACTHISNQPLLSSLSESISRD